MNHFYVKARRRRSVLFTMCTTVVFAIFCRPIPSQYSMFLQLAPYNCREFSLETESILRKGLSLAKIGVWGIQTDTQVLQLSDEAYKIFGFPSGRSYCYSDILRIAHEDDRNRIDLTWQSASQNDELFDVEFRVACSEATRWIRIQCEFRPDGLHAFGIVQDVTSQKIDQERLESIERELQEIMDALDQSSLVSIADRTGKILKVNKRFCEVAKYKEEELVGKYHNIVNSGYHSTE